MTVAEAPARLPLADFVAKHQLTLTATVVPLRKRDEDPQQTRHLGTPRQRWARALSSTSFNRLKELKMYTPPKDKYLPVPDPFDRDMIDFDVVLAKGDRSITIEYRVGIGHCAFAQNLPGRDYWSDKRIYVEIPQITDVLDCLRSDASSVVDALTFEEWAGEFGFDEDSRRAERTYRACQEEAARLRTFLGYAAFHELLNEVEPE